MEIAEIQTALEALADPEQAAFAQRFFKTGPGEYGEGDVFRGIRVPQVRKLARRYRGASLDTIRHFLRSTYHEDRLFALVCLVDAYRRGDAGRQEQSYRLYLDHTVHINSWDLVDISAPHIVGAYLADKDRAPLHALAQSTSLWERRIAVLATFPFIKQGDFVDFFALARMLLHDPEDLIHKATGWMLREVGKQDRVAAEDFLDHHCRDMPRTMLRYAIEKLPKDRRQYYLRGGEADPG